MPAAEKPSDDATSTAPAEQGDFFRVPARFGAVPVAEEPFGYDRERRFEHHYPRLGLPLQVVERVETGAATRHESDDLLPDGLNRLFFGDCLHVMRMLPSESLDLIYIDPPFFSGRSYNIVFGDRYEVRSFSDIWEGGMPGYLIWLNARLFEMKRLLRSTGNLVVHCDWHASHYIKLELDRLFGYDAFRNEIIWSYHSGGASSRYFARKHDVLLWYTKNSSSYFFDDSDARVPYTDSTMKAYNKTDEEGRRYKLIRHRDGTEEKVYAQNLERGRLLTDVWDDIPHLANWSGEKVGYPTQKPERLLDRIVRALCPDDGTVADFVCGGGTTAAVAQGLGRKWVACDISRVAVSITEERVTRILAPKLPGLITQEKPTATSDRAALSLDWKLAPVEDAAAHRARLLASSPIRMVGHTVEHFGTYDVERLTKMSEPDFRAFVLACYGARKWVGASPHIHGTLGDDVLWIGKPDETDIITASNVRDFAQAVLQSRSPAERNAIMIAWNVDPSARGYAERVVLLGQQRPTQAIKLTLLALAGEQFRTLAVRRQEYRPLLTFVLRPDIPRIGVRRLSTLRYEFDISEARSMNPDGVLTNAQWDFGYNGLFTPTVDYALCRHATTDREATSFVANLRVEYTFETAKPGTEVTLACRVQDDLGGELTKTATVLVE